MQAEESTNKGVCLTFLRAKNTLLRLFDEDAISCMEALGHPILDPNQKDYEIEAESGTTFDKSHLEAIIDYYSECKWKPVVVEKIVSSKLEDYFSTPADLAFILRCNDTRQHGKIFECAQAYNFLAASRLCLVILGVRLAFDPNELSTLQAVRRKLGIKEAFDSNSRLEISRKYPSLTEDWGCDGSADSNDALADEDGEEEDNNGDEAGVEEDEILSGEIQHPGLTK